VTSEARKGWLLWVVAALVVLNMGSLGFLWYGHLHRPAPQARQDGKPDPEQFLIREVGLDETQAATVKALRKEHFRETDSLQAVIRQLKRQVTDELFVESPDTGHVRSLTDQIGREHARFEQAVFEHFEKVKELCTPEQRERLRKLTLEALDRPQPPQPSQQERGSRRADDRQPAPRDDRGQRPPDEGQPPRPDDRGQPPPDDRPPPPDDRGQPPPGEPAQPPPHDRPPPGQQL
jgi:periplasmic protein CpxP/Spy